MSTDPTATGFAHCAEASLLHADDRDAYHFTYVLAVADNNPVSRIETERLLRLPNADVENVGLLVVFPAQILLTRRDDQSVRVLILLS